MKKRIIPTVIFFAAIMFSAISLNAHEPSSVDLNYDLSSQTLSVRIGHYTYDVTIDYIDSVEIKINGKTFNTFNYTSQYSKTVAAYSYKVDAKPGDTIEVTATSKAGGSKTASITVSN
jgi:hypothetical protein